MLHRLEHLAQVVAALGRDGRLLGFLEGRPPRGVLEVLETWQAVGDRAHVAAALNVVLAAERVEPAAITPDFAREQREVDERKDVVDSVVVLRDSERPADHGPVTAPVSVRDLLARAGGHPPPG